MLLATGVSARAEPTLEKLWAAAARTRGAPLAPIFQRIEQAGSAEEKLRGLGLTHFIGATPEDHRTLPRLVLRLTNVPLLEVLPYAGRLADYGVRWEGDALVLFPAKGRRSQPACTYT